MSDPDNASDASQNRIVRGLHAIRDFLEGLRGVVVAAVGVIVALGAGFAVFSGTRSNGDSTTPPQPSVSQPSPRYLSAKCKLDRPPRRGATVRMTYRITSSEDRWVGLGAGLYDDEGNDRSTGYGDRDSVEIPREDSSITRPVLIPRDLPRGHYELNGEIWPENRVGAEGAELLREASCTSFMVH